MSEIKITPVDDIEAELAAIEPAQQPVATPETDPEPAAETPEQEDKPETVTVSLDDLSDEMVMQFFEKKGRKIEGGLDSLFVTPEPQVVEKEIELDEDVATFHKFKKETGRGLEDFMKLQKDFSQMTPEQVLAELYSIENPTWDREDVLFAISRKFGYDQDMDDPSDIREKELLKKSEVARGLDKLNTMKAQYSTTLESRGLDVPDDVKAEFETFKQQKASTAEQIELNNQRTQSFIDKTMEVFPEDFKGFDFEVEDGKSITFKPEETEKIIQKQTNLAGWLDGFKDENGFIKDAKSFHKAIQMAMYGDTLIKHAYEQGKADQVVELEAKAKNIDMPRNAPPPTTVSGLKISSYDPNAKA
jgi:hypothetical protein